MHPLLAYRKHTSLHETGALADGGMPCPDGAIRRWLRSVVRDRKRREMVAALQTMDDRLLSDIGIARNGIEQIVDGFDDRELGLVPVAPKPGLVPGDRGRLRLAA